MFCFILFFFFFTPLASESILQPSAAQRLWRGLLGQDEDLHDEYTAEYEAGARHVVLEGWQCRGSVLLGEKGRKLGKLATRHSQCVSTPGFGGELHYEHNRPCAIGPRGRLPLHWWPCNALIVCLREQCRPVLCIHSPTSFSRALLWKNNEILWMSSDFSHCLDTRGREEEKHRGDQDICGSRRSFLSPPSPRCWN